MRRVLHCAEEALESEWLVFKANGKAALTSNDLAWIPEKWWQPVTSEIQRNAVLTRKMRGLQQFCPMDLFWLRYH